MKNGFKLLLIVLFLSCADEFVPENPIDPENPDYIPPIISITEGIVPGQIIEQELITIQYSGNEVSMLFRTRLDSSGWSGWFTVLSVTLDYLDEGDHDFYLQGKYTTGDTSEVTWVPFTVDAVQGPALMFLPRKHAAEQGQTVSFSIMAEEVYDLAGLELVLNYDPAEVVIQGVASGDIFAETGDPIFLVENVPEQGSSTITAAVWGEDSPAFTGTAAIAVLTVRAEQAGSITIQFDGSEIFRDPNNSEIQIQDAIPGLIVSD